MFSRRAAVLDGDLRARILAQPQTVDRRLDAVIDRVAEQVHEGRKEAPVVGERHPHRIPGHRHLDVLLETAGRDLDGALEAFEPGAHVDPEGLAEKLIQEGFGYALAQAGGDQFVENALLHRELIDPIVARAEQLAVTLDQFVEFSLHPTGHVVHGREVRRGIRPQLELDRVNAGFHFVQEERSRPALEGVQVETELVAHRVGDGGDREHVLQHLARQAREGLKTLFVFDQLGDDLGLVDLGVGDALGLELLGDVGGDHDQSRNAAVIANQIVAETKILSARIDEALGTELDHLGRAQTIAKGEDHPTLGLFARDAVEPQDVEQVPARGRTFENLGRDAREHALADAGRVDHEVALGQRIDHRGDRVARATEFGRADVDVARGGDQTVFHLDVRPIDVFQKGREIIEELGQLHRRGRTRVNGAEHRARFAGEFVDRIDSERPLELTLHLFRDHYIPG